MSNSTTLPIPPPPPPPNIQSNKKALTLSSSNQNKPVLEECLWALKHPELQKACFLARICMGKRPLSCKFFNIASILQVGPTCGLTAVSMLMGGIPTADQLLHDAQQRQFSYNGEMFSAFYLYQLICDYLPIINNNNNIEGRINANEDDTEAMELVKQIQMPAYQVAECEMHEGRLNCSTLTEALLRGACIFVPYPF